MGRTIRAHLHRLPLKPSTPSVLWSMRSSWETIPMVICGVSSLPQKASATRWAILARASNFWSPKQSSLWRHAVVVQKSRNSSSGRLWTWGTSRRRASRREVPCPEFRMWPETNMRKARWWPWTRQASVPFPTVLWARGLRDEPWPSWGKSQKQPLLESIFYRPLLALIREYQRHYTASPCHES